VRRPENRRAINPLFATRDFLIPLFPLGKEKLFPIAVPLIATPFKNACLRTSAKYESGASFGK
jgi:hypothetical protein